MFEVLAVRVSPTWAVPLMLGSPVAGVLACSAAVTVSVASLVAVSEKPSSSVKVTRTWTVCPSWPEVRVRLEPGGAVDVGPAGGPLVLVGRVVEPVAVGDAGDGCGQGLTYLWCPADGGNSGGREVDRFQQGHGERVPVVPEVGVVDGPGRDVPLETV